MKKRSWGIALLVIGILAIFGSYSNGFFEECAYGIGIPEITAVALIIAAVVGGIVLIITGKE